MRISNMMNADDASPLNNVLAKDFFYTEDVYGHDNEVFGRWTRQNWGQEKAKTP